MKISVQNLGPIKEGTIDLSKNLTVFCGPNGTGKTFMSMLIHEYYFLSNSYAGMKIREIEKYKILNEQINKKAKEGGILEIEIDINIEILKKIKSDIINILINPNNLKATYGLDKTAIEKFTKNLKIEIQQESLLESFFNLEIKEKEIEILIPQIYIINISKIPNSNFLTIHFPTNYCEIEKRLFEFNSKFKIAIFFNLILPTILDRLFNNFRFNNKLILSDRTFDLIPNLLDYSNIASGFAHFPEFLKRLCMNSFEKISSNKSFSKIKSHYYDLVVELEAVLIGGSLFYDDMGEIMFKNNRTNLVFPYLQVASSVKSLASFFLYLKHEVRQNETIIIDEPEMNLHPDMQVMFARIIARLINAGLKFIISTHSDFILREFNTLIEIGLHEKTKSFAINEFKYKSDEFINKNDINIFYFYFKEGEIKSSIKQLEMDEFGFSVDSIDQVIDNSSIKFEDLNALLNQIKRHEHNNLNIVDFNNEKNIKITQVAEDEEKFN